MSIEGVGVFVGGGEYEGLIAVFRIVTDLEAETFDLHGFIPTRKWTRPVARPRLVPTSRRYSVGTASSGMGAGPSREVM